jgi:hypothetical protein
MSKKNYPKPLIIGQDGDPCPRCGQPTEIRSHASLTAKHLAQPFYYSRWFYCTNRDCVTKQIVPDRFRVFRDDETRKQWEPEPEFSDIALDLLDGKLSQ